MSPKLTSLAAALAIMLLSGSVGNATLHHSTRDTLLQSRNSLLHQRALLTKREHDLRIGIREMEHQLDSVHKQIAHLDQSIVHVDNALRICH
jgi:hypothetical protein